MNLYYVMRSDTVCIQSLTKIASNNEQTLNSHKMNGI